MSEIPKYITARTYAYRILRDNTHQLRNHQTDAEYLLWQRIRSKQIGAKFRRQHIIDDYIVDFVCLQHQLIIEVDGKYHASGEQKDFDAVREQKLKSEGYHILRFTNEEVINNLDQTIECIKKHLI